MGLRRRFKPGLRKMLLVVPLAASAAALCWFAYSTFDLAEDIGKQPHEDARPVQPSAPASKGDEKEASGCDHDHLSGEGTPDVLHVVFATDPGHGEGVQAAVASVLNSTGNPRNLIIHLLVQPRWALQFKQFFGVRPSCNGTKTKAGAFILIHDVVGHLKESVATLSSQWERKEQSVLENFARFRLHLVLGSVVAVYLDTDTIVQADLRILQRKLYKSGKTVAFVKRDVAYKVSMKKFLKQPPQECNFRPEGWAAELLQKPAYNVGVWVVDFKRWVAQGALERVENFIAHQNTCNGALWLGGSQAPLLLAFLDHPAETPDDYIVVDASWNHCNLGGTERWTTAELASKRILHWSGKRKPWLNDGLYKELWLPHRERLSSLL